MIWSSQTVKRPGRVLPGVNSIAEVLCLGLLVIGVLQQPAFAGDGGHSADKATAQLVQGVDLASSPATLPSDPGSLPDHDNLEREAASEDVRHLAGWVVGTADNHGMPFVIIDKVSAKVYVFNSAGALSGAAPVLLGMAVGDDASAGIRKLKMADIGPGLRVTPAGRFLATLGHDTAGKEILWVDYDNSIALHSVVTNRPKERRLQRLDSPTPLDHRISWGCINVPKKFYESVVSPAFTGTQGVVYVLPEIRSAKDVFGFQ